MPFGSGINPDFKTNCAGATAPLDQDLDFHLSINQNVNVLYSARSEAHFKTGSSGTEQAIEKR
ncbi:hypothetical protein BWR59_14155 [Pseudomonas sp. Bc-h]|jgi:hypothetical protein|uniref:hypothetical protein n=1 Tax=Pseudomonas sp. Bc-h TaxID=1943632 RepID=UPI0009DA754A|nr:hypothetical protein [Pseudomonas sp. Bc-h]OQR31675.1 hypothetical protein BWR59_14155 [Pseudomonas sp. Bc-h]